MARLRATPWEDMLSATSHRLVVHGVGERGAGGGGTGRVPGGSGQPGLKLRTLAPRSGIKTGRRWVPLSSLVSASSEVLLLS